MSETLLRAARSAEAVELSGFVEAAELLADRVQAWLDAHGDGCACPVCWFEATRPRTDAAALRDHLAALAYNLRAFTGGFDADRPVPLDDWPALPDGTRPADVLSR